MDKRRVLVYNVEWIRRKRWRKPIYPLKTKFVHMIIQVKLSHPRVLLDGRWI